MPSPVTAASSTVGSILGTSTGQSSSPVCHLSGRFSVQGHAGVNRVLFPRRASRLQLDPGTYRISARTPAGRLLRRVTIVVVEGGAPSSDEISSATGRERLRHRKQPGLSRIDWCVQHEPSGWTTGRSLVHPEKAQPSATGPAERANSHSGAVLGTIVEKHRPGDPGAPLALLALAIVLLGAASLPRTAFRRSSSDLPVRHRVEIAGLGAAAFFAVEIAFLVG